MSTDHRAKLKTIKRFDQLIAYLRDEMNWPLQDATWDELTFDFTADELGIDPKTAAKIQETSGCVRSRRSSRGASSSSSSSRRNSRSLRCAAF